MHKLLFFFFLIKTCFNSEKYHFDIYNSLMTNYPIKQFPGKNEKIVVNITYTIFGVGEINTKDGLLEAYIL